MNKLNHKNRFFYGVLLMGPLLNSSCQNGGKASMMEEKPSSTSAASGDYEKEQSNKNNFDLSALENALKEEFSLLKLENVFKEEVKKNFNDTSLSDRLLRFSQLANNIFGKEVEKQAEFNYATKKRNLGHIENTMLWGKKEKDEHRKRLAQAFPYSPETQAFYKKAMELTTTTLNEINKILHILQFDICRNLPPLQETLFPLYFNYWINNFCSHYGAYAETVRVACQEVSRTQDSYRREKAMNIAHKALSYAEAMEVFVDHLMLLKNRYPGAREELKKETSDNMKNIKSDLKEQSIHKEIVKAAEAIKILKEQEKKV